VKKRRSGDVGLSKTGTTIGILGHPWRATVDRGGNISPWDGSPALNWLIAAEDRWHKPADEIATRQISVAGTPVLETRVRVPQGDVIQRIWVAPGREVGPAVIIEFENDSARAVAIAVSRDDVVAPRAAHDLGSLPGGGIVEPPIEVVLGLPLGHRTRVRIGLPCGENHYEKFDQNMGKTARESMDHGEFISRFGDWSDVVRGWTSLAESASRFVVPDIVNALSIVDVVTSERCQLALDPPVDFSDANSARQCLIAWRDLERMGLDAPELESVVSAVEMVARDMKRRREVSADVALALMSAAYLLRHIESEDLATTSETRSDLHQDLLRVLERATGRNEWSLPQLVGPWVGSPLRVVDQLEDGLIRWSGEGEVTLCPDGLSDSRLGANIEAHGVAVGPEHTLSFALRWHGAFPAVIWEVNGPPGLRLLSGVDRSWSTADASGEALWRMEISPATTGDAVSFS
jgi:hypothetical protein